MAEILHLEFDPRATMLELDVGLAGRSRNKGCTGHIDRRLVVFDILD